MTNDENQKVWSAHDWSRRGDEWSDPWGGTEWLWWGTVWPRIMAFLPASTILEIAPGFGRFSHYLKDRCRRLVLVDLTERCIEACRERFRGSAHVEYHVNDGRTLQAVPDGSVDFAFSFDSLVHVEADAMESYIRELARKLAPHGVAFLHHSNFGALLGSGHEPGALAGHRVHWRATSMSAALMKSFCEQHGVQCTSQEVIDWRGADRIDCLTVLARPGSPFARPYQLYENGSFAAEADQRAALSRLYPATGPGADPGAGSR